MTIVKEEPGLYVAVCDTCGERYECNTPVDDPVEDAVDEIEEIGWTAHKPETVKFPTGPAGTKKLKVEYATHSCGDCA